MRMSFCSLPSMTQFFSSFLSLFSFLPSFLPSFLSFLPPSLLSFLFFLGQHLRHMEVSRLGVKLELQLPAYATTIRDPNHVCDLHHSSWQHRIPNPLSEARDRTRNPIVPSWILQPLNHDGNSYPPLLNKASYPNHHFQINPLQILPLKQTLRMTHFYLNTLQVCEMILIQR